MPIRSCRTFEDNAILKHDSDTFNTHDPLRIKFRPSLHTLFRSFPCRHEVGHRGGTKGILKSCIIW